MNKNIQNLKDNEFKMEKDDQNIDYKNLITKIDNRVKTKVDNNIII